MNIAELFVATARRMGERTAIVEAGTGKKISFAELNGRSNSYSAFLAAEGVKPCEKVMLMVSPSIEFIALTIALFKLGATVILIDPGMGFRNLLRCIERVMPKVLVGIPKALIFARIFRHPFSSVSRFYCVGRSLPFLGKNLLHHCRENAEMYDVYKPKKSDLAAIIFTTGSTGPPKGVRYEHSIFSAQLGQIVDSFGITEKDVDQPAFPLFALFSTAIGACAIIPDMDPTKPAKVDPERFIISIAEHGVTFSFGSPAIWNAVSRYCEKNHVILHSVKKILMAGAPVPYDLLQRVKSCLPDDAQIFTPYGATESLPITSLEAREILDETWNLSRTGQGTCVGRPLPGIDIRIIDISDGVIDDFFEEMSLPINTIGEIIVRGAVVTRGYENNEQETKLAKIRDQTGDSFWHRMGDVGYLDDKGRLWFCGRRAHRVVGCEKTYFSVCCEAIVNEHPAVYRSALVGIREKNSPENIKRVPVLIVEPYKDISFDENTLLREVAVLAAGSELTKDIKYFLVHSDFPVDIRHNAKIFREKLAVWAENKICLC